MHARAPAASLPGSARLELSFADAIPTVLATSWISTTLGIKCGQHHLVANVLARIPRHYDKGKVAFGVNLSGEWGSAVLNQIVDVKFKE